jgi:hypothetical protein
MSGHPKSCEPRVEESWIAPGLVLVYEDSVARSAAATRLTQLLREQLQRFIPAQALELSVASHHRAAITIRIVKSLQRRLTARAKRAAIHGMIRIPLEFDRTSVTSLSDDATRSRTLTTCRRVVGRHARHGLIGRHEIWNQSLYFLRPHPIIVVTRRRRPEPSGIRGVYSAFPGHCGTD